MADNAQNLRTYMLANTTLTALIADRVHESQVPQTGTELEYLWFQQNGKVYDEATDDDAGIAPRSIMYDVECCSRSLGKSVQIADAVRGLFPYRGAFGDETIKGGFVRDQSEDYVPANDMGDGRVFVQSLQIEICP